jgi:hypothetical protein
MKQDHESAFVFPRWVDDLTPLLAAVGLGLPVFLVFLVWYGGSPATTDVGYEPAQPVPYSHALHAGEMGIDCRYCHTTVEIGARQVLTQTCMNCHTNIRGIAEADRRARSNATGLPVPWVACTTFPTSSTSTIRRT